MVIDRPATRDAQGRLVPTLGLFTTIMLIVGSMIGSGIFRLPAAMMAQVQSPTALLWVWIVGGLFTICGALVFAELAGMFPHAGGQYVFLRESLGKKWAFLYGWTFFWVVQTGIIAGVAVVFAEVNRDLFGFAQAWVPIVAVACILLLSLVNYLGVRFGGLVQNIFTVAKVAALLALVVLGFLLGHPDHPMFQQTVASAPGGLGLFSAFFSAMVLGLFALDGWPQAAYVAPEVKDPKRNVPRAMIVGVLTVTAIYVLATAVYLYLVSVPEMLEINEGGQRIGVEAARAFGGDLGAKLIAAAIVVSTFGTVNAYILTSPRIFYALAADGVFWHPFRKLHPRHNTPHMAILYQGIWAGLLVVLGSLAVDAYNAIVQAVVYGIWLFYIPTIVGYFLLRRRRPDAPRPYRTTFYPVVPLVFFAAALLVVGNFLFTNFRDLFLHLSGATELSSAQLASLSGVWGTLLILTGVPVLLYWRWKDQRTESAPDGGQREPGAT